MSEAMKIALTALAAVLVFVIGQIIVRIFIEPLQEQRGVIGRIAHALIFYHGISKDAPGDRPTREQVAAAQTALRGLAADLRSTLTCLPWYRGFSIVRLAYSQKTVKQVAYRLMRWELFMSEHAKNDAITDIAKLLNLDYIKDEWIEFQAMMDLKVQTPADEGSSESPVS